MAWERRTRGGQYYTKSRKVNGRVVREYLGCGPLAAFMAQSDADDRALRTALQSEQAAARVPILAADRAVATLCEQVDQAVRDALLAAGYHQHARGAWRKKRG
jgi:hypothetical protein